MFSIRQNFTQRSTRLPRKRNLLGMDYIYNGQPYVEVVGKNENTTGLDVVSNAQPFLAAFDNKLNGPILSGNNHPDVQIWINTITLNGGTANNTVISALNTFCTAIDSAGIRNKIYRLNLICGDTLSSALVPIYTRPFSSYGPEYGNSIDEGVNFTNADYNPTGSSGGLKGNGSTKYLKPAMIVSRSTGNESVGCYVTEESTVATPSGTYYLIGSHSPSNINRSLGIAYYNNQYNIEDGTLGISPNGSWATSLGQAVGFRALSSNGLSSRKMYLNGSVVFSNTNTTTASVNAISPYLFARSDSGNSYGIGNQRIAAYFIGISMTDSNMLAFYNAIQAFQTSLGRNV